MMWYGYMCAAPEWGGWGSLCLSWEFVRSFEPGDKRRQYSAVAKGDTHPITGQTVGVTSGFDGLFQGSENMPTVYSLKYWRCKPGENNKVFNPISLTFEALLCQVSSCSTMQNVVSRQVTIGYRIGT